MWFDDLLGFKEVNPEQVRENVEIFGNKLISKVNKNEFNFGKLEIPTLEELRSQAGLGNNYNSKIQVSELVGNVQTLHQDKENNGAFFQVASQFNLLEMVGPNRTPEDGVAIYENDYTQGPACAIACGAGTIYRNYFVNVGGQIGQNTNKQIDCLENIGVEFENKKYSYWKMKNGYVLSNKEGLILINEQIKNKKELEYEHLKGKLKIGIQWDTEVTLNRNKNIVTQAYCSALPVAYSSVESELWESFARLILEATYEATFFAALRNFERTGNNKVFLTLVGGGAFGNNEEWIFDAIKYSINKFSNTPLDIRIVSYRNSNLRVKQFIDTLN